MPLIQRSQNSLIRARGQRRESRQDLCPCYMTIIKEKSKVCGPATTVEPIGALMLIYSAEKSSWLNLARAPTTSDQWRQATCRLREEEEEGCVLNVYLEVSDSCSPTVYISTIMISFHSKLSCSSPSTYTYCCTPISAPPTNRCSFVKIA